MTATQAAPSDDVQQLQRLVGAVGRLRTQVAQRIVGQEETVDGILTAVLAGGHALLIGVPGLAKTLMVQTVAEALNLTFNRVQFTPDLMPSDITGTDIIEEDLTTGRRAFRFVKGPIFANMVLADEINRTPPKTQAALLQAMQEHQVTAGGTTYHLPDPFFVLATQNPIEQEGTYPLPEAQLDRFLFLIRVDYPSDEEEGQIMRMGTSSQTTSVQKVLSGDDILKLQQIVRKVPVTDHVIDYAKKITRMSRPGRPEAADFVNKWVTWGAGPRASMNLILAAKARAVLEGRHHVSADDVAAVARPILRHRLITNFAAQSEGVTIDDVIKRLLQSVGKNEAA
jgi:MoxR-like ATPase